MAVAKPEPVKTASTIDTVIEDIRKEIESGTYKWEDSAGLYHSCGVCGTALNNNKALKTCYGTHSEPCIRYHQTMFRIGESHKCEACRNANEQHDKRHREIAELVQKINLLDGAQSHDAGPQEPPSSGVSLSNKNSTVWSTNRAVQPQPSHASLLRGQGSIRSSRNQAVPLAKASHASLLRRRESTVQPKPSRASLLRTQGSTELPPNPPPPQEKPSHTSLRRSKESAVSRSSSTVALREQELLEQGLVKKASLARVASRILCADGDDGGTDGRKDPDQHDPQKQDSSTTGRSRRASLMRAASRAMGCNDDGDNGSASLHRRRSSTQAKKDDRELKKAAKLMKETDKAQHRHEQRDLTAVFSQHTLVKVDVSIHGYRTISESVSSQDLCNMLLDSISLYQQLETQSGNPQLRRRGTGMTIPKSDQEVSLLQLEHIRGVFNKLGVQPVKEGSTKERKELVGKLASAVWLDIELVAKEARETLRRMAGYWKWANKRTYNVMVVNKQIVQWSTSKELPAVNEEE